MVSERELVALLHRADWTKLSLSGTVRGPESVIDTVIRAKSDEPLGPPWERDEHKLPPPTLPPGFFGRDQHLRMFERMSEDVWGHGPGGPPSLAGPSNPVARMTRAP
jgi:hypothetical protein